ncbi:endonuclease/exonuclease/phosphatase family protein [Actinomadura barringtoniae]|uniref:Endonuclease/exonuclease/phosphatase family protein n=1 Tax=Actinomadura barringtoniae TaxID=1427535 RepID=A0A939T555_9ACTN|nr:endonuclease/exonuclease/phosphatase family protein [Actinomadura barringtoniae]MBO2446692.1 endonuclease/exonuclease/phosphatase family protein [Actinomadura barringtoniae]
MTAPTEIRTDGGRRPLAEPSRPPRRGMAVVVAAVVLAVLIGGHRLVPGDVGTLLDTALPWFGLVIPLLAVIAVVRRAWWPGLAAVLVPSLVWTAMFGGPFARGIVHGSSGGTYDLRAVSQNMYAANPDPRATVGKLLTTKADVLSLVELRYGSYPEALNATYPHHVVKGTVGIWSRLPIRDAEPVDLGLGWTRALRATISAPTGDITVYVAHLGSARPLDTGERDATMDRLAKAVQSDRSERVLLLGDLNTATTDRELGRLVPPLREAQEAAGSGMGFTWPSTFPLTRPDHILYDGMKAVNARTVETPGSDHHAVEADFRL